MAKSGEEGRGAGTKAALPGLIRRWVSCGAPPAPAAPQVFFSIVLNPTGFTEWDVVLSHNALSTDAPFPFSREASRTAWHFLLPTDLSMFNHRVKIFHADSSF